MTDFPLRRNLKTGEVFSQNKVEDLFETEFGFQFKGITYRNPDQGKYIILMANEGEIYNDEIGSGLEFVYEGEGEPEKGNQDLTNANRELRNAISEPFPVYFFESEEGLDEYEYQGLVDVKNCRYVFDDERMVYKYDVEKLNIPSWERLQDLNEDILTTRDAQPQLEDQTEYTHQQRRARSALFSRNVKQLYDYTCAICGARRLSPTGNPEVEAAHIYPKSENGSDDLRNGIALCQFHHWAFDSGWLSLSDDLDILVNQSKEIDTPDEIEALSGKTARESERPDHPHPSFLSAHRKLHGFE